MVEMKDEGAVYDEAFDEHFQGCMKGELRGDLLCGEDAVREWVRLVEEERIYPIGVIPFQFNVIEELTPEIAKFLLERNIERNRPYRENDAENIADMITKGKFKSHGEGLKVWLGLDEEGKRRLFVVDGQHRLNAVIKAGEPILYMGLILLTDEEAIQYIDIDARSRTVDDMRSIRGEESVHRMIQSAIYAEKANFTTLRGVSVSQKDELVSDCPFIDELRDMYAPSTASAGSMGAAIRCMKVRRTEAAAFFKAVLDPLNTTAEVNGQSNKIVGNLREFLRRVKDNLQKGKTSKTDRSLIEGSRLIKGYNDWREDPNNQKASYSIPRRNKETGHFTKQPKIPDVTNK